MYLYLIILAFAVPWLFCHLDIYCSNVCFVILLIIWIYSFIKDLFVFDSFKNYFIYLFKKLFCSVQFSHWVMSGSTPGFPGYHLPELIQTLVHQVGEAIQPSHPLLPSSSPAFNLSRHQGLFKWVNSSHQVAEVLEFQLQHQSFQYIQDWFPLGWTGWISL